MTPPDTKKTDFYTWVKIGGILSFIPFILVAGPLAGYFLSDYLEKRFSLPHYISIILITLGFAGSVRETIRIIKFVLKIQEKA